MNGTQKQLVVTFIAEIDGIPRQVSATREHDSSLQLAYGSALGEAVAEPARDIASVLTDVATEAFFAQPRNGLQK